MNLQRIAAAALLTMGLAATSAVQASTVSFDSIGDTANFVYSATVDGADLHATVKYELTSWSGSTAVFHVVATNSSSGAGSASNSNRLVSFGVAVVNPDLIGAVVPGITEWDATINQNLPGWGTVELCNYAGSNCAGGASLGVYMGATDSFDLTLSFSSAVNATHPISFSSPFPSKWQSVGVNGGSTEFAGCLTTEAGCGTSTTTSRVPEPASMALVSLGLLAAAGTTRRRRTASVAQLQQA